MGKDGGRSSTRRRIQGIRSKETTIAGHNENHKRSRAPGTQKRELENTLDEKLEGETKNGEAMIPTALAPMDRKATRKRII